MGGRVLGSESGSMSTLCPQCGGSGEMLLSAAALSA
jgi:DnaJ-class molecular chaperone